MLFIENETTELKRQYTDEIKRTVVAFANTNGGEIYIGIEDNGEVVGINNSDEVCLQAVNSCRNSIKPDITLFLKVETIIIENKKVVKVTVFSGVDKPYYLADKGLKPAGVMVRVGSATVPASEDHIRMLIKMSDGERYIEGISLEQDLIFDKAKEIFKNAGLAFGRAEYRTLGLIRADGRYSNLALLLSDQCKHTIKAAVFEGTTKAVFRDRKEFSGSLFSQLEDVFKYVDFYNKTNSTFKGLERIDKRDYPENAIREALLNAMIHREYSYSGSILVNLYDDRLEVVSLGGVVQGLTLDSIISGISQTRNEKLANIFYRLKFVEAYGTGIPRIIDGYSSSRIKPEFTITNSSFSVKLPNLSYTNNIVITVSELTEQEKNILNIIKSGDGITRKQIMEKSNLGATRSYNILIKLIESDLIYTEKNGKETIYTEKK